MFRIRSQMPGTLANVLGIAPFILLLSVYFYLSHQRLQENPKDRLMPGPAQFLDGWRTVWNPRESGMLDYTVQPGDTCESVARRISSNATFAARIRQDVVPIGNPPRTILPGERLRFTRRAAPDPNALPGFDDEPEDEETEYTVVEGDTVESLAARFLGEEPDFKDIKPIPGTFPRDLVPGEVIRVPLTERRLVVDIRASLWRLAQGLGAGVLISLVLGVSMGAFTPVDKTLFGIVAGLAKIPPLAILPIIFIFQGTGESAKVLIIALGIAPTMTLDILLRTKEFPRELIIKAYTLGASTLEIVFKVIVPAIWPQVLNAIRLVLGPAWVYLIASEAIASEAGLGYRIFIVQRQLGMNIILLYVVIIMTLGLLMDTALRWFVSWRYKWAEVT